MLLEQHGQLVLAARAPDREKGGTGEKHRFHPHACATCTNNRRATSVDPTASVVQTAKTRCMVDYYTLAGMPSGVALDLPLQSEEQQGTH